MNVNRPKDLAPTFSLPRTFSTKRSNASLLLTFEVSASQDLLRKESAGTLPKESSSLLCHYFITLFLFLL